MHYEKLNPIRLPIPCSRNNHPVPTDTLTDLVQTSEPDGHLDLSVLQNKINKSKYLPFKKRFLFPMLKISIKMTNETRIGSLQYTVLLRHQNGNGNLDLPQWQGDHPISDFSVYANLNEKHIKINNK